MKISLRSMRFHFLPSYQLSICQLPTYLFSIYLLPNNQLSTYHHLSLTDFSITHRSLTHLSLSTYQFPTNLLSTYRLPTYQLPIYQLPTDTCVIMQKAHSINRTRIVGSPWVTLFGHVSDIINLVKIEFSLFLLVDFCS